MDSERPCLSKSEIKAYLDKSTSEQERFEMEKHLLDCNLCQDAISGYIEFPKELNKELKKVFSSPTKKWLALAASILFLAIGGYATYSYHFANYGDSVFAQFYQKPSWDIQTRGNGTDMDYSNAIQNYNQGLYQAAVPSFDSLLVNEEENNQMRLYKGIAHLEMNQLIEAEQELNTVRINSDLYFEEASWYLALLNIKLDQVQEAIAFLDEIIELENSFYQEQAIKMKNKLQK